ncbi:hypothetical protein DS402_24870 [Escherichia coli]|nr:hypothetical protein [Escherichia coli]
MLILKPCKRQGKKRKFVIFRRTHIDVFSGASSAVHTNDRSLTMVDLFCLRRGERQAGIGDGF